MERDFFNISRGVVDEEAKGCRRDSGLSRERPFTKKAPSLQQFIPQKAAQEDRTNEFGFRLPSSLTFKPMKVANAFVANHPNSLALVHQKSFSLHDHPPQITTGHFSASSRRTSGTNSSVPVANNNPFFKLHDAQSATFTAFTSLNRQHSGGVSLGNSIVNMNIGTLAPRNMAVLQTTTAQLTIFYAGAVHVYDGVSSDKAEAIMALASEGSSNLKAKGILNASRSEAPFAVTAPASTKSPASEGLSAKQILCPTPLRVASPCSGFSNPISVTSIAGANSSGFGTQSDTIGATIVDSLAPSVKQEPSITLPLAFGSTATAPRAVTQARKA